MVHCFYSLIILLLVASSGSGFNSFIPNPLPNLVSKFTTATATSKQQKLDPQTILKEIGITPDMAEPRFAYARMGQIPTLLTAGVGLVTRLGSGVFALGYTVGLEPKDETRYSILKLGNLQLSESGYYNGPSQPLVLYEYESNPECRLVREACSMLSLTVTILPTPENGPVYRAQVTERFRGLQENKNSNKNKKKDEFPFLYDPNTQVKMAGAADILPYLFQNYGRGNAVPASLDIMPSKTKNKTTLSWWSPQATATFAVQLARLGAGGTYRDSNFFQKYPLAATGPDPQQQRQPSSPSQYYLTLWAYEGSPFCKIVRESLSALAIPHTIIYAPRGSVNRQRLYEATQCQCFQVPYLQDPNTGVNLFESEAIVAYLEKYYGLSTPIKYL